MPSPFPGMDPYLERPDLWPEVHSLLMGEYLYLLKTVLPDSYTARLNVQAIIGTVWIGPDVAVTEPPVRHDTGSESQQPTSAVLTPPTIELDDHAEVRRASLEVRTRDGDELVTVIELLSPVNKRPHDQRYGLKRARIIEAGIHLLEIDLLREGQRILTPDLLPPAAYYVTLRRAGRYPPYQVWAVQLADSLPVVAVPLRHDDADVPLDLGAALTTVYDRADYARMLDYTAEPIPPLTDDQAAWAEALLREQGVRPTA